MLGLKLIHVDKQDWIVWLLSFHYETSGVQKL